MISEKTVELNLTTELINWFYTATGKTHFAIGPSLQQEAKLGFDVAIRGGVGALVQYKRAYVNGTSWTWHLNRTKGKDQHLRLQNLEAAGFPVFYAFPFFSTIADIQAHRRSLLLKTFWFKTSQIMPAGGPTGHHDVVFDTSTNHWTVHSEQPTEISKPLTIYDLAIELERTSPAGNLHGIAESFNSIVLELNLKQTFEQTSLSSEVSDDLVQGAVMFGRENHPPAH